MDTGKGGRLALAVMIDVAIVLVVVAWFWMPSPAAREKAPVVTASLASGAEDGRPDRKDKNGVTPWDRELFIRMVYAEAGHEKRSGQLLAALVIKNRWKDNPFDWKTIADVVTHCGKWRTKRNKLVETCQFEPMATRRTMLRMIKLKTGSPDYRSLASVVDEVLGGYRTTNLHCDPWYFVNHKAQKKLGRKQPAFSKGKKGLTDGRHTFYCK